MADKQFTQADVNERLRTPVEFGESDYLVVALDTGTGPTTDKVIETLRRFGDEVLGDHIGQAYDYDHPYVAAVKFIDNPDYNEADPPEDKYALSITEDRPAFAAWAVVAQPPLPELPDES